MSAAATAWAWATQGLSATQKLVLLYLADAYYDETTTIPKSAVVANAVGVTQQTASKAMNELCRAGLFSLGKGTYSMPIGDLSGPVLVKDGPEQKHSGPPCPHGEIIALYHKILPELKPVIQSLWTPGTKRYKDLERVWHASEKHQRLVFWERFFSAIRGEAWHMGDNDRNWRADLQWLVEWKNFVNMVERLTERAKRERT